MQPMSQEEIQQKLKDLEKTYKKFQKGLKDIRQEQDEILAEYSRRLDEIKVAKLTGNLRNQ